MLRAILVVVATLGLVLALLYAFQRRLIYLPSTETVPAAADVLPGAEDVVLETTDGLRLAAWFVPPGPDGTTVLVANGNAGDRAGRAPLAAALSARGLGVLLFDYRGYGSNSGSPSEQGFALDARAAYRFLVEDADVPPDRLIYLGESLGAGVVTELATEHPPGGLVLRSPFIDLASVGQLHYPFLPVRWLLRDRYPVSTHVATLDVPTTVVYGTRDATVPPEQSRAVAEAAAGLTQVVPVEGADHNDRELLDGATFVDAVVDLADLIDSGK